MEDGFVVCDCCVEGAEGAELGVQGAMGGLEGLGLRVERCDEGGGLRGLSAGLVGEGGGEGGEEVFFFGVRRDWGCGDAVGCRLLVGGEGDIEGVCEQIRGWLWFGRRGLLVGLRLRARVLLVSLMLLLLRW